MLRSEDGWSSDINVQEIADHASRAEETPTAADDDGMSHTGLGHTLHSYVLSWACSRRYPCQAQPPPPRGTETDPLPWNQVYHIATALKEVVWKNSIRQHSNIVISS